MKYQIYEGFMEELTKKVNRISKKCDKYGCDFTFKRTGEIFKNIEVGKTESGKPIIKAFKYIEVEAKGTAVINNWEFVARIDHTPSGNIFAKALNDVEIPERYRNCNSFCEHCNSMRKRNNTFIVRNTVTGEFKQVGRNCLCDYTHGMSLDFAAFMASMRNLFEEASGASYGTGGSWKHYEETEYFLKMTAETVRHYGYSKRYIDGEFNPNNTTAKVEQFISCRMHNLWPTVQKSVEEEMERIGFDENSEETVNLTSSALEWIRNIDAENDYFGNLKILANNSHVEPKHYAVLASLIPSYIREVENRERKEREKKENAKSEYIGNVGQRIDIDVNSGKCVTSWETDYGYTYIYKFTDEAGNVIIWKTGNCIDEERVSHIRGTVKEHSDYNGVKQTVMTRCKIEERR